MKKLLILFFTSLFAITPQKITFDYYISKVTFNKNYLITGLENGNIIIKDFKTLKTISTITLPKIEDFMGDKIASQIYSLDIKNNKLLILSQGEDNSRNIFVFDIKKKKLTLILKTDSDSSLMRAKFINDNILFAYLSDEIALYNPKTKKYLYKTQLGEYVFSTWAIYQNKVAIGDESGDIKIANITNGKKLYILSGYNKDKTISLDIFKNLVINGSSDKKVSIYKDKNRIIELQAKFLPYGACISKDKFAFYYDENNDIALYNFNNKKFILLKGHTMPVNGMKFADNKLISFSPAEILIWNLKGFK